MDNIQVQTDSGAKNPAAVVLVAAAIYLGLGALGLSFAIAPGYASPIFPAAGFAVAILLWSDKRAWPGIWVGSFALNLGVAWLHGESGWSNGLISAGIASGSTIQALAAWWLVKRKVGNGWQTLEIEADILRCLALSGPVACVISASIGVTLLYSVQIVHGNEYLYAWWNWWSGDVLGVLVMLPLSLALLYWRKSPWRGRFTTLVLPMLVVLGLAGGAFFAVSQWERAQQKSAIQSHGEALAKLLEQRFIAHQEALSALRRLVEVTPDMSYKQFEYFTRITLKDNPDIFALSFNPYVLPMQRQAFERGMAEKTGMPGFEIKERDSLRRLVRAEERPEYVAVGFIAPLEGNRPAVGYDINSEPVRHDAIQRAMRSGEPAVTAPIQLVQENRKRVGVLLMHPADRRVTTLDTDDSKTELMGFAIGVIKVDEMVDIATRSATVKGLVFRVDDALAPADKSSLYLSDSSASSNNSNKSNNSPDNYHAWQKQLTMADRTWTLSVYPTAEFLRQGQHWASLMVGAGGLVLAALLQMLLLVTTGRTSIVQRKVREQTSELQTKSDALEDRNAQLSALFRLCPDGFVAFDPDGRVKFANPSFAAMTGIGPEEVVGKNNAGLDAVLRKQCESPEAFAGISACFGDANEKVSRKRLTLKTLRQSVLQIVGIRSESSSVSRILYFRDVTLETEVDLMKSEFLSTAAHELRTPMASIYGFAEVLLTQELDEDSRREFLSIIFKQSELMASILNELLDLARIEARRGKDFIFEATQVQALVNEVVNGYSLPPGRAAPILVLPAAPLYINADHKKTRQAFLNVLSNAYKYSSGGDAVRIEVIAAERGEEAAPRVGIRITDNGIGMTPEQLSHVFERFYRADSSGKIPGTGLGMSIVHEIVDLHGGDIEISSMPGVGTSVTLWLPGLKETVEE
ncbi:CHASE domain-containing protein [Propionivibrio sp.]|uniref:CHASE domain-containing protein n=1 Tax=Propionivibrio sp. TaxID=2212460 RepID=UPI003BF286E8